MGVRRAIRFQIRINAGGHFVFLGVTFLNRSRWCAVQIDVRVDLVCGFLIVNIVNAFSENTCWTGVEYKDRLNI